ncbi:3-phosphoglycerate dehydrogenase [Anaerocolumna cellulosilytica]|uniref:D-3-phosphoglycerate dehydrogenase n=1 Tax=Anaerocolumna cellulosilytica TaxID=433286 RepID=A0A6S6R3F0_9FIRM|nr:phosphoglycerate dehydrogenase [Anaerocolumna cellulosilytica]MBB5194211.1 D-3-phosphoglycerate dehydrogenase [Anaerocolumna cellulosilytica]BCJ94577.1 3-phosphoglycerate dehydrogenase [Anaerocolumna cellulosilytica]
MVKYNCLNPIAPIGLNLFTEKYEKIESLESADAVLVRSASMLDLNLPENLKAIARAGAGVNNIPLDKCAEKGIVVFNTPGANANGVKELVIAGLMLASRDIVGGINWVQSIREDENVAKLVEKGKSKFAGKEILGKKFGVIGLGAIGVLVANAAKRLGMEVYGCDPYISVEHAWNLSRDIISVKTKEDIYKECDYITVHVPLLDDTKKMINKDTIAMMKDGVVILNFARDLLVNDEDMEEALKSGKVAKYVTDFPNAKTAGMEGVIAIPHLGASTEESEDNCAVMAVKEIKDYMEYGIIKNSVNYPDCDAGVCASGKRITINHKNIPNMLSQFTGTVSAENINISNLINKSKGDYAYTVLDIEGNVTDTIIKKLNDITGVLKVRVI